MSNDNGDVPAPGKVAICRSRLWRCISWTGDKIRRLRIRYFVFLIFMEALSEILGWQSGLSPLRSHLLIEAPLLLALYWALNFALRPGKLPAFVAALPFVIAYVACDIFFVAYGDVLRIIDLQNLPELLKVLPFARKAGMILALGLPPALLLAFVNYQRYWRVITIAGLALLGTASVEFFPDAVLSGLQLGGLDVTVYSDAQSVNDNGRLTMAMYFEATRRVAIEQTDAYRQRGEYEQEVRAAADFIGKNGNRHNVYLVVLESWVDPTLFRAVTWSRDPRHPDFTQLVGEEQGFSISPVFGGGTAQAEFEALCGVPALQAISDIEFDVFTGHAAGCMPGILHQAGYATYVSNAYQPDYFNSTKAYTGIGFEKRYYPIEYARDRETYLTVANASDDETYLFDGDLFNQNLAFVARTLREHPGQPIFNYVLTMYGHAPHDIDTERRPLVLSMKAPHDDQQLLRAANQYWYRTQAIAGYIRALIKLDPSSLIILVSDHVPPFDEGTKSYKDFRYLDNIDDSTHMNRIVVVEDGKVVRHKTIHHYNVPSLIYDYLTSQRYCAQNNCDLSSAEREDKYRLLISRAVSPM
ncbi:MAG: sulfatase-like hydrolase/transferase [Terracidiphilus sp.]|jgi:phosphoglycerol transferase MdoB-like AlkP superfamily enzyme